MLNEKLFNRLLESEKNDLFYHDMRYKKDEYTEEEIYKHYNQYLENILELPFDKKWLHPKDLFLWEKATPWEKCAEYDPFLEELKEQKLELARDIYNNGTYWAFIAFYDVEKEKYVISEGSHRIEFLRILYEKGEWDMDRKILTIILPQECKNEYYHMKRISSRDVLTELRKNVKIKIPSVCVYDINKDSVARGYKHIKTSDYKQSKKDKDVTIVKGIEKQSELLNLFMLYPIWLRNIIHNFKGKYGRMIKPSKYVNDEEAYNEWVEDSF